MFAGFTPKLIFLHFNAKTMRSLKNTLFYVVVIGVCSYFIYLVIDHGQLLQQGRNIVEKSNGRSEWAEFLASMTHNLQHPLAILLAQIITIILAARVFGWLFRKIGQPSVMGEMVAGIVLGPSLVGAYFPEVSQLLFPVESLGNLHFLSQIGLILFMFVIGMELDLSALKNKADDAVLISHASIVIPFSLGIGLSYIIYQDLAPPDTAFLPFALFLGIAMSITAFPVLARIVQERGIHKTRLGSIVITCAAADDITAWCILAAVIAVVNAGSFVSSLYIMAMAVLYVIVMLKVVRPFLKRVGDLKDSSESLSKPVVAIFLLMLIISSYATEVIGIHALFGAFMAGAIMPENTKFRSIFIEKVEDISVILLLPLFFVYTGLKTQINTIDDPELWKMTGIIVAVAVAGKFVGSAVAARFVGQNWADSLTIGALMNTRGLMQLIVLNIGLELGVLSIEIFTMMVIMALITTFMTGPALDIIDFFSKRSKKTAKDIAQAVNQFKILISYGSAENGKSLLNLANALAGKEKNSPVSVLHMTLSNEMHTFDVDELEAKSFVPIEEEAARLNQPIVKQFKISNDIDSDIVEAANTGTHQLLLVGMGKSIFEGTLLGRVLGYTSQIINPERLIDKFTGKESLFENSPLDDGTRQILTRSKIPVGILVDNGFERPDQVLLPIFSADDSFLIDYATRLIQNNGSSVTIVDPNGAIAATPALAQKISAIPHPTQVTLQEDRIMKREFLVAQDLMIVSLENWKKLVETRSVWLGNVQSVLIVRQ